MKIIDTRYAGFCQLVTLLQHNLTSVAYITQLRTMTAAEFLTGTQQIIADQDIRSPRQLQSAILTLTESAAAFAGLAPHERTRLGEYCAYFYEIANILSGRMV